MTRLARRSPSESPRSTVRARGAARLAGRLAAGLGFTLLLGACGSEDDGGEGNVLPTQAATEDPSESSGALTSATMPTMTTMTTSADTTAGETDTELPFPVAYRFECVDIQALGDADGTAFQANLLEDTWASDIDDYKLNIIFEVVSRDGGAGIGEVAIRSGVGTSAADLCAEPTSQTEAIEVGYDSASALWAPSAAAGTCSAPAEAGAVGGGSYTMALGPGVLVYIYAQDVDGMTFNCTADAAVPDAVPVRGVEAELTASPDGSTVAGQLTGCLLGSEAESLCSCLGACNPKAMNENCAGCPDGSVPLRSLLQGINPSPRCSALLGADAFDLTLGFSAVALPNVPTTCG